MAGVRAARRRRRDAGRGAAGAAAPRVSLLEPSWRVRLLVAAAAFIAALLERWWFSSAWHEAGSLTSAFYYGDAQRLVEYAIAIAQGRTFDNGIPFHPPGWPILLAAFLKLFGSAAGVIVPVAAVKALLAALSAGAVAVAALIAYEVSGSTAMLVVALLGPFHFGHIVEGAVADTEALYSLCVAVAVLAALYAVDGGPRAALREQRAEPRLSGIGWTGVAGAVGGYAMLVRAEFIACALLLGAAIVYAHRDRWLPYLAAFAVLYTAVLVPPTVWHWRSLGAFNASHGGRVAGPLPQFAPVTSYGPFNFAMANHENADGGPNRDHPMLDQCNAETTGRLDVGQLDLACPAVYDLYVHGYRIGAVWILSHPADAVTLAWHKLAMASGFLAHGYLVDDVGAGVDGTRRRVDLLDPDARLLVPIHLALVGFGAWVLRRRPVPLTIVAAPLVALVASTVLFYGYVRLGTAYLPAVWVLQGCAIAAMTGAQGPARRARWWSALALMAVLLLADGVRLGTPRRLALDGSRTDDGALMQDETVKIEVRR